MALTVSDLPNEVLHKIFNERLTLQDVNSCSLVCHKWNDLTCCGYHWKKWLLGRNRRDDTWYKTLEKIAHVTSWKTAYMAHYATINKKQPPFWNDIALFQIIQQTYPCSHRPALSQFNISPPNGMLWAVLQLQLTYTGIQSRITNRPLDKEALNYLRTGIMVLNKHLGPKLVLDKLREIAEVPPRMFFEDDSPRLSSLLLLAMNKDHVSKIPLQATWPTQTAALFNWKTHFVLPVQAAVLNALRVWAEISCGREMLISLSSKWLIKWLSKIIAYDFWVERRQFESAVKIAADIRFKSKQMRPLQIIHHSLSHTFLDGTIPHKELAIKLSSISYKQFLDIPESDLLSFLIGSSHQWSCGNIRWFVTEYGEGLIEGIMNYCSGRHSKGKKVCVVQRVISIAHHLKEMRDFRTMKTLVSAVRAIVGQTHITGLTWKDLNMKHCKLFKKLEDIFDHKSEYKNYQRCIQDILARNLSYVPYLPAHRHLSKQHTQRNINSVPISKLSFVLESGVRPKEDNDSMNEQPQNAHSVENYYVSKSFDFEELFAAQHMLQYFRR